jgi:hypothetical protein
MAREKPLGLAVVQTWLAAWDKSDLFSDAAIQHLQSLIRETHCIVVVSLGMGREPHSLVFRRRKYVSPATLGRSSCPMIVPSTSKSTVLEPPTDVPRRNPLKSTDLIVLAVDIPVTRRCWSARLQFHSALVPQSADRRGTRWRGFCDRMARSG